MQSPLIDGSSNLITACSANFSLISIDLHFLPDLSAQNPVVLLPANGSKTMSPGSVRKSIKNVASSRGILAGCELDRFSHDTSLKRNRWSWYLLYSIHSLVTLYLGF